MKKSFFLTAFLCRTDGACVLAISWDPGCSDDEIESKQTSTDECLKGMSNKNFLQ